LTGKGRKQGRFNRCKPGDWWEKGFCRIGNSICRQLAVQEDAKVRYILCSKFREKKVEQRTTKISDTAGVQIGKKKGPVPHHGINLTLYRSNLCALPLAI
jgi:hypothetical protein